MKEVLLDMVVDDFYTLEKWRIRNAKFILGRPVLNSVSIDLHVEF